MDSPKGPRPKNEDSPRFCDRQSEISLSNTVAGLFSSNLLYSLKAKKNRHPFGCLFFFGSPSWTRTNDLRINSPPLYRLSYWGIFIFYPRTCLSALTTCGAAHQLAKSLASLGCSLNNHCGGRTDISYWGIYNLSQHLPIFPGRRHPSIFGTTQFNYCVRNGNRWDLSVISTG